MSASGCAYDFETNGGKGSIWNTFDNKDNFIKKRKEKSGQWILIWESPGLGKFTNDEYTDKKSKKGRVRCRERTVILTWIKKISHQGRLRMRYQRTGEMWEAGEWRTQRENGPQDQMSQSNHVRQSLKK